MAKKTVLKLLLSKYAPMSVDMQSAVISDQAVIRVNGADYMDNPNVVEVPDVKEISTEQEAKDALLKGQIDKAKYDELLSKALGRKDEPEEKSFAEQQIENNAFGLKDIAKEHGTATENS